MLIRSLLIVSLLAASSIAQERSIVCIKVPNANQRDDDQNIIGKASTAGTGAIIKIDETDKSQEPAFAGWVKATILTAWHVVDGNPPFSVTLAGGEQTRMNVIRRGKDIMDDIAVGVAYIPLGYEPISVYDDHADAINAVVAYGLSGKVSEWPKAKPNVIDGRRIGRQWLDGRAYYDLVVAPGDSGGPILADGKLVGVIQGGLMRNSGKEFTGCWPLVSVSPSRVQEITK